MSRTDDGCGCPWLSAAFRSFAARLRPQRGPPRAWEASSDRSVGLILQLGGHEQRPWLSVDDRRRPLRRACRGHGGEERRARARQRWSPARPRVRPAQDDYSARWQAANAARQPDLGAQSIPDLQTADEMPALIEVELVHQPYGYSYSISGMDHGLLTVRQSRLLWCPGGSTDPTAQWGNEVVVPRGVLQRTSASVRMPPVVALSPELWSTSPGVWRRGRQLSGPKRGLPAQPLLVD